MLLAGGVADGLASPVHSNEVFFVGSGLFFLRVLSDSVGFF